MDYLFFHFTIACLVQYATLYIYFYLLSFTPDPPYSLPKAFLIIVIGSIGV